MLKFGKGVVKLRIPIIIIALVLLIPAFIGMQNTRINYDMLTYLPKDIDTVKGQNILLDEFGKGAFSFIVVEGMADKDVSKLRQDIEKVPHVESAIWYDSFADLSIPKEMLPDDLRKIFLNEDDTIMAVFFDTSSSADETIEAVEEIREIAGKQCFVSGISAMVTDLKNLCEKEEPIYVGIAVICAFIVMEILLDSWLVPLLFLIGIGMTILYNMGTNIFFGEISYITKALAAVLQLAVTMDYSIFLWHAYCKEKQMRADKKEAMAYAVKDTVTSVAGSSLTTIAGFIALCFMSYTMGVDIGLVMAKGCLLGVIGSVTILPALILVLDKPVSKTMHRSIFPDMSGVAKWITGKYYIFIIAFAVLIVPAFIGYQNIPVYYDFAKVFSGAAMEEKKDDELRFLSAQEKVEDSFNIATTHMILLDSDIADKEISEMEKKIEAVDGVTNTISIEKLLGSSVPEDILPKDVRQIMESEDHKLMLVNSEYAVSSDECNKQIDAINNLIKEYDDSAMLIGEGPCTKDLIEITDRDFSVVAWISIAFVFIIILFTLRSVSLPVILVAVIEFAVFINLGIPHYTGNEMSFIAPICISTIQLGSTVDYAILITTQYKERRKTEDKKSSITGALAYAMPSVITSAVSFFAATIGVAVYSDIDLIGAMCKLLARGAVISMFSVLLVLPALLMLLDKIILHTTLGVGKRRHNTQEEV